MKRFISWSGGKDSTASIIICHEQGKFDANAEIAVGEKVVFDQEEWVSHCNDFAKAMYRKEENTRKETAREILEKTKTIWKANNGVFSEYIFDILALEFGIDVEVE